MCGWQVKLCDPLVTHGPYLSALEMLRDKVLYKFTFTFHALDITQRNRALLRRRAASAQTEQAH